MTAQYKNSLFGICFMVFFCLLPHAAAGAETPPPSVTFAVIGKKPATQPLQYLGRIEAINFVNVQTRTEGFIQKIHFEEGQMVAEGDLLFEINPDLHSSAVDQATAEVNSAQAALNLAELMNTRLSALARTRAVSQTDADRALADRDIALAALRQAQSELSARELRLSFTKITAPIAGRIGHTPFSVGSYISTASGSLVNIAQLDPIRVTISVRERDFISATLNDSQLPLDLFGKDFAPQLRLANGKIYPQRGTLDSISNRIDPLTGSIEVRGRFSNPLSILLPGGVADVTLDAQNPPMVPVVPTTALQQDREGHFVLLLDNKDSVVVRHVTLGRQIELEFIVEKGLEAGDRVIVEGLQRVRPGMVVSPVPQSTLIQ